MDRRWFLGRVIGTLIGTQVPFVAQAADPIVSTSFPKLMKLNMFYKAFNCSMEELKAYRMYIVLDNDVKIWAPGIETATRDLEKMSVSWKAFGIKCKRVIRSVALGVTDPTNQLVKFSQQIVNLAVGDSLHCSYTINCDF